MDSEHVVGDSDRGSRKRKKKLTSRERKKLIRYSDPDPKLELFERPCKHHSCNSISLQELQYCRAKLYKHADKVRQDTKLSHLLQVNTPRRKRSRKLEHKMHHGISVKYQLWISSGKKKVCQKMFLSVFGVSQRRVQSIAKNMKSGLGITENRGGDQRSHKNMDKKKKVKEFIGKLKGRESHYGRAKSRRIYLSSEFNITKLCNLYNSSVEPNYHVNYKFFSRIFNSDFNIGFGSPATDVCGFCVRHQNQFHLCTDAKEKDKILTDLRVHKVRAKQFHKMMNEEPDGTVSYCFDLQQVQVLPKVPVGDAFYAQQLSLYSFCVTDISSKKPIFYTWLEHQAGRGSIEIGSALFDFLLKTEFPADITELRLYSDGCSGQNKNSHIVHMLLIWLQQHAPSSLKSIRMTFPVRGHSFLPADRVFGRAEKLIRSHSTIKTPEKYWDLYSQIGSVRKLGENWKVYDFKEALNCLKKISGISEAKRIFVKRMKRGVGVKTEQFYRNDDESKMYETLLKKGQKMENILLPEVTLVRKIKDKKLKSLHNLLVEIATENWRNDPELAWLIAVFPENIEELPDEDGTEEDEDDEQAELCRCQDDDGGIMI